MGLRRLLTLTGLVFFAQVIPSHALFLEPGVAPAIACRAYLEGVFTSFPRSQLGLRLVPGGTVRDQFPSGGLRERLEDVLLYVNETDDLEGLARTLSVGNTEERTRIYGVLLQWSHAQPGLPLPLREVSPRLARCKTNTVGEGEANCWNATLVWHDFELGLGHTPRSTMLKELKETAKFRELTAGESLRYGDVIAFFSTQGQLDHTAIYLDDNLVWHKISSKNLDPYTFDTLDNVLESWTVFTRVRTAIPDLKFYRRVRK